MPFFKDKTILVTGCCGTIGSTLVNTLLESHSPKQLIGIDNNESALFFKEQECLQHINAHFFLCDIQNSERIHDVMKGVDIVFHTAAFKHVILCERSPSEAIRNNVLGVQNIIEAAQRANVKKVVFTSSDKAVNPTNVMGTSKLMGERLFTAANSCRKGNAPLFASTRFGNVLGSQGSVIPIFREQIRKGGPVTLTDENMTRFIMTIKQAVDLVILSGTIAKGGEVFVTKMPTLRIKDLAQVMIEQLAPHYGHKPKDIPIELIGAKAGEKLYEELVTDEETRRTIELNDYFVVLPAFKGIYESIEYNYSDIVNQKLDKTYTSDNSDLMSKEEIHQFLIEQDLLLPPESTHPDSRYWPGD